MAILLLTSCSQCSSSSVFTLEVLEVSFLFNFSSISKYLLLLSCLVSYAHYIGLFHIYCHYAILCDPVYVAHLFL